MQAQMAQTQPAEYNKEIEQIYSNLEVELDSKIRSFWNKKQQEIEASLEKMAKQNMPKTSVAINQPNVPYQPKSLPWFANGIKGFLRKIWHGDNKSNPDWNSIKESFSINEYVFVRTEIENILFETELLDNDEIKKLVSDIMISVKLAVEKTKMYKNRKKYTRIAGTVDVEPTLKTPETTKNEPVEKTEKIPEPIEQKPTEIEIEPNSVKNEPAPIKNKIGEMKEKKTKEKKQRSNKAEPIPFEQMKMEEIKVRSVAKDLNNIISNELANYMNDTLTKTEMLEKAEIHKKIAALLAENGIELAPRGFIASTQSNAVKLVQILKELSNIEEYYNWTDIENYHDAIPGILSKNTNNLIQKAIDLFQEEQSRNDMADPDSTTKENNESFNQYLNNKNKLTIKERKNLFKNLIKENNQHYEHKLKLNRTTNAKEKVKLIKELINS